jgi:serine/threonine protein kinase
MSPVQLFLERLTQELLFNIVYDEKVIDFRTLSDTFESRTGHRPMDFFGYGNLSGGGWFHFINTIPGVQGTKKIFIEPYPFEDHHYKVFNSTSYYGASVVSTAKYREMILIKCCEIMEDHPEISSCKDANGNTLLHFIVALPGISHDCDTLVRYLLQVGVDPLAVNDDGQTFLHIIFGRFEVENGANIAPSVKNKRAPETQWFLDDRIKLLNLLSQELSPMQTALLAKAQDKNGNTVLHEHALSTALGESMTGKDKICKELLQFGASLRIANNVMDVPLHYAYSSELFRIFVQQGAGCRARNDRDETPVLFIMKMLADLAFAQTSAIPELVDQGFVKTTNYMSVPTARSLLESLMKILSQNKDAKETVWIPDIKGNVAIDLVLIAIRCGSYNSGFEPVIWVSLCLIELLKEMLRDATPSDMKQTTKKGQSFLHVLLDIGDDCKHTIVRETFILQSVEILLVHNADVNSVDAKGRTPLDIVRRHQDRQPSLYKKCGELLMKHGATGKRETAISSQSSRESLQRPSSLTRMMSNLGIQSETRKLRSCPKRHLENARRLTDPNTEFTVVEKYRYSDRDIIGSGAFSSIFVAIKDENVDSMSGKIECRAYALKRMEKAKTNPKDIKREITTLLSLSCENIIKCHEAVEDQSFHYLCLDLMDGDLHEFVTNSEVNKVLQSNPVTSVKEIINGIVFLHREKFIHRDLKPGNILYTTDPTLHFKIADFGLTKNTSSSSMMSSTGGSGVAMAAGSRCWMAPELVSMQSREHTTESDIFALGLVLHYLLTLGKHPFGTESEPAHVIERNIVDNPPNLDRALRAEVTSFLHILLPKSSFKRPPAAYLGQHPYLWSDRKKIEFLKAVGSQKEATYPMKHPNSALETRLQNTLTGRHVITHSWDQPIRMLYLEMITAWGYKNYRTDKLIDLIRFIRNAYAHRDERTFQGQQDLLGKIFIPAFPSLVLDVFSVVQELGLENDKTRSSICEALTLDT